MLSRKTLHTLLGGEIQVRSLNPYIEAFTHVSMVTACGYSQERLEWLGDSLWQAALSVLLHKNYEFATEHALTRVRMKLLSGTRLADIGRQMHLEDFLHLSDEARDLVLFDKVYEDTFEALVGAIFVDQGFDGVLIFVRYVVRRFVDGEDLFVDDDYKKMLYGAAKKKNVVFSFETIYKNQQHRTTMTFGDSVTNAQASQKRIAESQAAKALCAELNLDRTIRMW